MSTAHLKRAFLMPLFAFLGLVLVHSGWRVVTTGFAPVWIGALAVAGAFFAFMGWMMRSGTARTSANLPVLLTVSAAGVVLSLLGAIFGSTRGSLPVAYALLGFGGQILYVSWYSRLGRVPSPALRVGEILPEFELEDESGRTLAAAAFRGSPAVFLFYRGNWCPLCMAQIRELADQYKDLEARGAKVALVSPQSHDHTRSLAARFDVPFRFLVDPGGRAARQLGILHEAGVPLGIPGYDPDTVLPTAIVTDAEGRILLADQTDNYRVRPEPETFLAALDRTTEPQGHR
jgi:peroxiredoxin